MACDAPCAPSDRVSTSCERHHRRFAPASRRCFPRADELIADIVSTRLPLLIAVVWASVIAAIAWRRGSLSASGALAATVVGTISLTAGWAWGGFLIAWFVLASVTSRLGRGVKQVRTARVVEKGMQRDVRQVAANGGIFAAAATVALLAGDAALSAPLWGSAALAAAGADTLATEIGTWVGGTPRTVFTWRRVPVGSSGAVTLAGTSAMLFGAILLAAMAVAFGLVPLAHGWIVATAAVVGASADTLIGAVLQQRRWCPLCLEPTEQPLHLCGTPTLYWGGWKWLANDEVNLACTLIAAGAAWMLGAIVTSSPR